MRSIKAFVTAAVLASSLFIVGGAISVSGQETMMKQAAKKVATGTKKGYKKGLRVGHTIGNRTWTGTRWVSSNTWKGGKWIVVKTANGTKWVYRKGKGTVTRTKKRVM